MREQLERRPLVLAVCGLVVGLTAISHPLNLLFLALILGYLRTLRTWTVLAASLCLGLIFTPAQTPVFAEREYVNGLATIASIPMEDHGGLDATATIDGIRLKVLAPPSVPVSLGDEWHIEGVAHPAPEASQAIYEDEGLQGWIQLSKAKDYKVRDGDLVSRTALAWRGSFDSFVRASATEDQAEWLEALCFRSTNMNRSDQNDISQSGSFHLVAASGMHVVALSALTLLFLGLLRLPRTIQVLGVGIVLVLYCLATGCHLPTVRASLASLLFLSAAFVRREPDILSALALACFAYLTLAPSAVYGLAFQLSAAVIAGLALFGPKLPRESSTVGSRVLANMKCAAVGILIVVLAGQPILSAHTGTMQFGAFASNVLLSGVMPVILCLSFLAYAVHWINFALAKGMLAISVLPLLEFSRAVVHGVAAESFTLKVPDFNPYWLTLYYGLWLVVWRRRAIP